MHIVYVTMEFPTEIVGGGLSAYLGNISSIMADAGHEVTVITLSDRNERIKYRENIAVERVCIPRNKITKQFNRLKLESFFLNQRLRKLRKTQKIDIVQYPNCRALGLLRTSLPTVVRVSSDALLWRCADEKDMDAALRKGMTEKSKEEYLEDKALLRADKVFGPSRVVGDFIGRRLNRKIQIIESPYFKVEDNDETVYQEYLSGKKYLLTACSLRPAKGIFVIAGAIQGILAKYPDLYYALAGEAEEITLEDGERLSATDYVKRCAGNCADRVICLGNISKRFLNPVIQHAYAVVLPSRIDNLPNACIEAMGEGKIVLGTDGASFEQLIDDKESGLLLKRDCADSLREKVDELMGWTAEKRLSVEENARERIKLMDAETIGKKVIDLYRETINQVGE